MTGVQTCALPICFPVTIAGGIAKVEYKDQSGDVLWYYDDAGNFVRNGNAKITGLAGTGNRMVAADATGNLSASTLAYSENTYVPTLSTTGQVGSWTYGSRGGKYITIGKKVTIYMHVFWIAKPSAGTALKIELPVSLEGATIRGFLSEYSGVTFAGKQLSLGGSGLDTNNSYLYQNITGSSPVSINVSDLSSTGYFYALIEGIAS